MKQSRMVVKSNKDLYSNDGTKSFSKNVTYSGYTPNSIRNLTVINNQGEDHIIGLWDKYFNKL